jgi:hypothetical protein
LQLDTLSSKQQKPVRHEKGNANEAAASSDFMIQTHQAAGSQCAGVVELLSDDANPLEEVAKDGDAVLGINMVCRLGITRKKD